MLNDVVDSLVVLVTAALPEYKSVDPFYTPIRTVDGGSHPKAMVYDPVGLSVSLRDRQDEDTIRVLSLYVRKHSEGVQMRTDLDAVVAAVRADPSLTDTVLAARVTDWGSAERQSSHTTGAVVFEVKLVS